MKPVEKVLGFHEEGLRGLHFYIKGLEFPIVAAEYTDRDSNLLVYLDRNVREGIMDSEAVCQWCISHQIYFRILYGIKLSHIFRYPRKTIKFLQMRVRLKDYAAR